MDGTFNKDQANKIIEQLDDKMRSLLIQHHTEQLKTNFQPETYQHLLSDEVGKELHAMVTSGLTVKLINRTFFKKIKQFRCAKKILTFLKTFHQANCHWDQAHYLSLFDSLGEQVNIIHQEQQCIIVHVKTAQASKVLGKTTSWCISNQESADFFNQFIENEAKQYFLFDFSKAVSDNQSIIGITLNCNYLFYDGYLKNNNSLSSEDPAVLRLYRAVIAQYDHHKWDIASLEIALDMIPSNMAEITQKDMSEIVEQLTTAQHIGKVLNFLQKYTKETVTVTEASVWYALRYNTLSQSSDLLGQLLELLAQENTRFETISAIKVYSNIYKKSKEYVRDLQAFILHDKITLTNYDTQFIAWVEETENSALLHKIRKSPNDLHQVLFQYFMIPPERRNAKHMITALFDKDESFSDVYNSEQQTLIDNLKSHWN
jgi:hypothetical protein